LFGLKAVAKQRRQLEISRYSTAVRDHIPAFENAHPRQVETRQTGTLGVQGPMASHSVLLAY
jgi:hypothetical protein